MGKKFNKLAAINKLVLIINILTAICLLISQLGCYISPAAFWPAEFIILSYPILLLINLFFIIFWLLQQNRNAFISLFVIIAGYRNLSLTYQLKFNHEIKTEEKSKSFSVMSYNVRLFDLYNWTGNFKTRAKIFYFLQSENPDILCFQEYYTSDNPAFKFENNNTLSKLLKASNCHAEYGTTLHKTQHWGLATFTSFPIVHKGRVVAEQGKPNFGMYTDVLINKDTVRIYNIHLQSNHFREEEYRFIEAPDSGTNEQILKSSKNVLRLLKKAVIKRAGQVDLLKNAIDNSPYPIILCGDFNDPPFSYAYQRLSQHLKDAFKEKGAGSGITLVSTVPIYRIDYILHDPVLKCLNYSVLPQKLSDHYAVKADFIMEEN